MHIRRFHPLVTEFPFLQEQLYSFLDTSASSIDGYSSGLMLRFRSVEADRFLMSVKLHHAVQGLPPPPRLVQGTLLRKEMLYAIGHNHQPMVYTTWNRNESQLLRDIFRSADPVDTHHLCLIVREQCDRISRTRRRVTQLCLHAMVILPPQGGFHSIA